MRNSKETLLNGSYSLSSIVTIFKAIFITKGPKFESRGGFVGKGDADTQIDSHLYYETDHAIILAPSSDKESPRFESIKEILQNQAVKDKISSVPKKILLFPIIEENNAGYGHGEPRNHWVTLHYDPNTRVGTILDSTQNRDEFYPTSEMKKLLTEGLDANNLKVDRLESIDQNLQGNHNYGGLWMVANIEDLSNNPVNLFDSTLYGSYITPLSFADETDLKQHFKKRAFEAKSTIFRPHKTIVRPTNSNPTSALSSEDENLIIQHSDLPTVSSQNLSTDSHLLPPTGNSQIITVATVAGEVTDASSIVSMDGILIPINHESNTGFESSRLTNIIASYSSDNPADLHDIPIDTGYSYKSHNSTINDNNDSSTVAQTTEAILLLNPDLAITPEITAAFQIQCMQAAIAVGLILLVIAVLICPPVAGALGIGIGVGLAVGLSSGAGALSACSFGMFASIAHEKYYPPTNLTQNL